MTGIENTYDVQVGQIWEDNDPRSSGRSVEVVEIGSTHATAKVLTEMDERWAGAKPTVGKLVRIRLDRFRPISTGWKKR